MARRDPETNPAAFLGGELRRARVAAGFSSQDALAAKLGFDRTVVAKAETGSARRPMRCWPRGARHAAWTMNCSGGWWCWPGGRMARCRPGSRTGCEPRARPTRCGIWQPLIIPGLLQMAEYARALFLAAGADEAKADELVAVRLERQAIFDRADPPHLVTILDESVLHRLIGSAAIMSDQLGHPGEHGRAAKRPDPGSAVSPRGERWPQRRLRAGIV